MKRPDQERFDGHVKHFELIDLELSRFAQGHGIEIYKNLYRTPCRVLRKLGNPKLIWDIHLDTDWRKVDYDETLPHSFSVGAGYIPSKDPELIYRRSVVLIDHRPFSEIQATVADYLKKGLEIVSAWSLDDIVREGEAVKRLKE